MTLGERIKEWREGKGLSRGDLADRMDIEVSAQTIGRYERDERVAPGDFLMALVALGCDAAWLLTGTMSGATTGIERPAGQSSFTPPRVDRDLWRALRKLAKELYASEGVKLPETVMDDIMISKYNILEQYIISAAPALSASEKVAEALRMIRIQLQEEMARDHPDAATSKHRA